MMSLTSWRGIRTARPGCRPVARLKLRLSRVVGQCLTVRPSRRIALFKWSAEPYGSVPVGVLLQAQVSEWFLSRWNSEKRNTGCSESPGTSETPGTASRRSDSQSLLRSCRIPAYAISASITPAFILAWTQAQKSQAKSAIRERHQREGFLCHDVDPRFPIDQAKVELVFFRWCAK